MTRVKEADWYTNTSLGELPRPVTQRNSQSLELRIVPGSPNGAKVKTLAAVYTNC